VGRLPRSKNFQKWKIFKSILNFGLFEAAFLLMDPVRDFFCKTHCSIFRVNDMYAPLPAWKYRSPFLLTLWSLVTFDLSPFFTRLLVHSSGSCKSFPKYLQFYTSQPLWCPSWPIYLLEILCLVNQFEMIIH